MFLGMSTVVDDIAAHAARDPQAPALETPRGVMSYRELAGRIERLALALAAAGVRAEVRCVVAAEHTAEAVIAMAAVMRAGGAFVTLDPGLPVARLHAMVRSAQARVQVTTAALNGRLGLPVPGPAVLIDEPAPGPPAPIAPAQIAPTPVTPDTLAYISHTSGSTGVPNPVLVEHGGLRAYLRFIVTHCELGPDTSVLQLAPVGYDASIRDIFAPLSAGSRLILLPRSTLLRPDALADAVTEYGADAILATTPTFLTALAQPDGAAARLDRLRLIVCAGESLRPFLAAGGRSLAAGRLVNHYGPTECTITSTCYDVPAEPDTTADLIGTPIPGVTVRLLDADGRPVPDGATGEIFIGGPGVARGYGGRPWLTAERFVPDPGGAPGERLYRTGDLARRRADGNLEFLGRADRQVKMRGYRVEPAEVEGALLTHPAVTGAVVTPATDDLGRIYLIAHVTGVATDVTNAALRVHLARTLPPHLLPRQFRRVDDIPTTHSGKADRSALAGLGSAAGQATPSPRLTASEGQPR
jgi:D-alanine--poly(phosphoribitol) ligase subunit 1